MSQPIPISKGSSSGSNSLLSGSVVGGSGSSVVGGLSPSPASFMNSPAFLASVGTPRSMTAAARGGLLPLSQLSPLLLTAQSLFAQSSSGGSAMSGTGGGGGSGIPPSGSSVGAGGIANSSIFPSTASVSASLAAGGGAGGASAPSTPALPASGAGVGTGALHIHTGSSAQGVLSPPSIPLMPTGSYPPTPHSTTAAAAAAHSLAAAASAAAAASSTAAGTTTQVSFGSGNRPDSSLRKTKIVCTLGPACSSLEMLSALLHAGMNIARFNFSHGSHEEHAEMLGKLRQACAHTGIDCAFLLDTKGPEIRTGLIKERTLASGAMERSLELHAGQILLLRTDLPPAQHLTWQGDSIEGVSVDYPRLGSVLSPGSVLKLDDGLIITRVVECMPDRGVRVRIENYAAVLGERKGVNLPGTEVDLEPVTEQDKLDLRFARDHGFHFVAASFTRDAAGIREVRRILYEEPPRSDDEFASPVSAAESAAAASAAAAASFFSPAHHPLSSASSGASSSSARRPLIHVIAKIESAQGLANFESILEESDGIMVARGDLGTEIPIQKVSTAQKMMIRRCNQSGKAVITATQMLESMCVNPRPTRAEATDVSNAVLDGSDAVMLSGETAKGLYPIEALRTMSAICLTSERAMDYRALYTSMVASVKPPLRKTEAVTAASVKAAIDMGAAAIIVFSESGASARLAAKYRPEAPIILLTPNAHTHRQSRLLRGVWSLLVARDRESSLVATALAFAKKKGWLAEGQGQVVILVSGNQPGVAGATNTMRILDV